MCEYDVLQMVRIRWAYLIVHDFFKIRQRLCGRVRRSTTHHRRSSIRVLRENVHACVLLRQ